MQSVWMSRLQRFNGGAVAALLAANALAIALLSGAADDLPAALADPGEGSEVVAQGEDRVITLVTTADGRQFVADPSTAEGREAIDNARDQGAAIEQLTVPTPADPADPTTTTAPGAGGSAPATSGDGRLPIDLGKLPTLPLDLGLPKLPALPPLPTTTVPGSITGTVDTVQGVVDTVQGTIGSTVDGVQQTAPTPLDPVVDGVQGTVDTVVDGVLGTVGSTVDTVVDGVLGTVGSTVGTVTAPLAPVPNPGPLTGLLGQVTEPVATTTETTTSTGGGLLGGRL